ncbi:RHS repeat-associated core domain-containing protein [Lentzea aerocolonigenes]|uniref:RHS repeat-associated core domain-containing protein n=1 Tax=Lentzea aerocolonigenes TaxID=68170 RepID=UPI000696487E|nr:RHS repeat-associated core domain-containing protein [Lentzea aerocolonigenes]
MPSGLVTNYTYDSLGRKKTETQISDSYPGGLTTTYTYDAMSRPVSTTFPATTDAITGVRHQKRVTTTYDVDGNAVRQEESDLLGGDPTRTTTTVYDDHNRVQRVVDPEGRETSYGYDLFGNRTSVVDGNGNRTDYAYTARNAVAEVRLRDYQPVAGEPDPGDYLVVNSYTYDYAGRIASSTDAMGRRVEYVYYGDDLLRRKTLVDFHDPAGAKRDYVMEDNVYDGAGHLTKQWTGNRTRVTQHTVNVAGQVAATVVDPGGLARSTAFKYDLGGNVVQAAQTGLPSNVPWPVATTSTVTDTGYDTAGRKISETMSGGGISRVNRFGYDQRGLLTSTVDPREFTTDYTNDELGRQISVTTAPVAVESGGGSPQTVRPVTTTGYDTFGAPTAQRDPLGNVTRFTNDRLGRPVTVTGASYTPPGGQPITPVAQVRYDGVGNRTEITDSRGSTARFGYDRLNRLVSKDLPAATNDDRAVWHYTYTRTGKPLSTTDPSGAVVQTTYDDLDREITSTKAERFPVADAFISTHRYDDAGNPIESTSPTGAVTRTEYDVTGAAVRITDPTGVRTQFGYDYAGRQVRSTDGAGRTARRDYDSLGRLITETDLKPDGATIRTRSYGYDAAGNKTSATTAASVTTTYAYNSANQLISQTEPVSATASITTSYGYDAGGARTRYTDGRGNATTFTVNSLRLAESVVEPATAAYPKAADRTWTTSYDAGGNPVRFTAPGNVVRQRDYDAAGLLTQESGSGAEEATASRVRHHDLLGRLTGVSTPAGDDTFAYNDRGQLVTAAGPSGAARFEYDADGNVTSRTDSTGTSRFAYDRGRLTSLTDGLTGGVIGYGYDAAGKLTTRNYGAGRVRTTGYDDLGRLTSDVLRDGAGQAFSTLTYGYDAEDHLISKTVGGTNNTYRYDQAGRLLSWTAGGTTTEYTWDAAGNRISAGGKAAIFDERNRLLNDGTSTYTYSARGTLDTKVTGTTTRRTRFDAFDRLTVRDAVHYEYDGLDRIHSRDGAGFGYAGAGDAPVSFGDARYSRDAGEELISTGTGAAAQLSIADKHGDVIGSFGSTDAKSATAARTYDPFGKVTGTPVDIGFQGEWTDPAGDVAMGARWYDSGTGTFQSRDDVEHQTGGGAVLANRYAYGASAPLDYVDPDGHMVNHESSSYPTPVWHDTGGPRWSPLDWLPPDLRKAADRVQDAVKMALYHALRLKDQHDRIVAKVFKWVVGAAEDGWFGVGPKIAVKVTKAAIRLAPKAAKVAGDLVRNVVDDHVKHAQNLLNEAKQYGQTVVAGAQHLWQEAWDSSYGQMYRNGFKCLAELDGKACGDMWNNVGQNLAKAQWNPLQAWKHTLKALGDGAGAASGVLGSLPVVGTLGGVLSVGALVLHGAAALGGAHVEPYEFGEDVLGVLLGFTPLGYALGGAKVVAKVWEVGGAGATSALWPPDRLAEEFTPRNPPARLAVVMGSVCPALWLSIPLINKLPGAVAADVRENWNRNVRGK